MDSVQLFVSALEATKCVEHIKPDQLSNPTPCSEWDLKALLNHLTYELLWVPDLLAGKTVAEVGTKYDGDVLGDDYKVSFTSAANAALTAIKAADLDGIVHLSYGDVPTKNYLLEITNDVLIHGWDVGQSMQCSVIFNEELAQTIYDAFLPRKQEFADSGMFGTVAEVPEDASIQVKLLALEGRKA